MGVPDKRRTLIISTAGHFFGIPGREEMSTTAYPVLDKFLDEATCRTLCAYPVQAGSADGSLKLSNELPVGRNTLVFFKLTASMVTEENFHDLVQVASTGSGKGTTLVEALRQVWAPILQFSDVNKRVLRKLEEDLLGPRPPLSIAEEEAVWERKREQGKRSQDRRVADMAATALKNVRTELESAAASREGLSAVEECLEAVSGSLDDLWKLDGPAYSEDRMRTLLEIISDEVIAIVVSLINRVQDSDAQARDEAVSTGATVCEKWSMICERLTGLFWPHHSLHPWKGSPIVPKKCAKMGRKLRQIAELRAQHRQLTRLLTSNERIALGTDALLKSFDEVQVRIEEQGEESQQDVEWDRLKRKVEEGLAPAEKKVADKLRLQIAGTTGPASLTAEFKRYRELLKRQGLRKALRGERETLLSSIGELIESCRAGPDTKRLLDSPQILQEVHAARIAELNLENLQTLSKELLNDLPDYEQAASSLASALKDAEKTRRHLVDKWVNETRTAVLKRELSLGTDTAVVELTGTSMMRVTYDPRLTTLVREARALAGQGVELPREVRGLVEKASSLAGRARALQQVATFHNTIGDRMVPSQRPLMLTAALELSRAVREQSGVTWSDPQTVDAYTARLRDLVRKFARQNSELAAKHTTLRELVTSLLKGEGVNLTGNQSAWKETLGKMRTVVDGVEAEYGNTKAWKLHWDRQLLKVLGVAYRMALPSLPKRLPEIRVELTFRNESLSWRPPLEEIRAKLYSALRRFLAIPVNFRGVGDPADGNFGSLVHRSAYLYGSVYKEAEMILSVIEEIRVKWMPLAAPAKLNVGERLKGGSPQEWERAFKDAKQWAQEVGKLRGSEVKVWCITIDTGTVRNDLESASRRYWERLSSDLRAEASSRLAAAVEFLSTSTKDLDRRPRNVEEVGLAKEAHTRIQEQSKGVAEELEVVAGLSRILAAWTREKLEGVSSARAIWESLADRLERHRTVVARQLEDAKVNLRHRIIALRDERERWLARWTEKPEEITVEWIASMRERWVTLTEQSESLKTDCRRIGVDFSEEGPEDDESSLARIEGELEAEESNCQFQAEFVDELKKQEDEEWSVARRRLARLHDWLDSWESRVRVHTRDHNQKAGEEGQERREVETFVGRKVKEVRSAIEWIQLLRGDELAEEHWIELRLILDLESISYREITLGHLLKKMTAIEKNLERVKEVTKRAAAESGIRQALSELETWEAATSLPLKESKDSKNKSVFLVGEYGGLLARAGELRLLLEGAKGAAGYERFAARASRCESALSELEERIKILSTVQRKWIYLEPVYCGGAAPNDSGRWSRADKEFRYLMGEVAKDPSVPSLRRLPLPALTNLKELLDRCQRSLDEFLEEKRSSYPRLYFLSDEDLLELVSGSGRGLEAHLSKLYQGVGSVLAENGFLKAVISPEGESLQLLEAVDLSESLSQWLTNLEEGMREALRRSLDNCLSDSTPDPSQYPLQILLLSERIRFTERCEVAMREGQSALRNLVESLETQRARYRGLEDAGDKLTALKVRGLLLDAVHHLSIARNLLEIGTRDERTSWIWSRQLRSYRSRGAKPVCIRCAGAEFPYRFEYQGAGVGLVRTPLTERCFLALSQAMKLGLGGSPTGPAGTGKTESVKALGAMLGRLVLVFNCDEGMDAGSMSRILGGLAQAGAWGCFDEFNRLEEETLSAVAMLVRPLQEAVRDGKSLVQLGNKNVSLNRHCCVFITMNPAGNEYGGRHKLPDSLARLFRPVAMAYPDRSDIVRALLECAGFSEASTLAKRLVETFDISEKLLSKQPHYDWGLRALRSVLDAVPSIGSTEVKCNESARLLRAIKDSTTPKLTEEDTSRFLALLSDVFQKVELPLSVSVREQDLQSVLIELCEVEKLGRDVVDRCIQLSNQLRSRAGVAVVGPAGSGKTLIRKMLAEALTKIGESVTQLLIYPGAVRKTRLLGRVDPRTREWKEGLLSSAVSSAGDTTTWIVLDGDVEPGWAEALNSALDDNRLLTLPNGVGVRLGSCTRFIFETHKLEGASPATVSRLGVVHLGSTAPASLLVPPRLQLVSAAVKDLADTHLRNIVDVALESNEGRSSASGLVGAALCHMKNAETRTMGAYSLLVSLCGQMRDDDSRNRLARLVYQFTDCWCPDPQKPYATLYSAEIDRLEPFGDAVTSLDTEDGPVSLSGPIKRGLAAILPWVEAGQPVLVRGSAGCGKSSLVAAALLSRRDGESSVTIRGSSLYGSQDLIRRLKRASVQVDSSSHGRTYKPRNGSHLVLILEDLHLASKDLQELLRELLQAGGFYEEDLEFAKVPLTVICTGDETTKLHPRLEALLATHYLPKPNTEDIVAIVELHLKTALKSENVGSWTPRVAPTMVEAFNSGKSTESDSFQWTPSDLALWADALKFYPTSKNDVETTRYLMDAGNRLFHSRLTIREWSNWESIIPSRIPGFSGSEDEVYAWKGGNCGLLPFAGKEWKVEVQNAAAKCSREGQPVRASASAPHILQTVADVSWALGSGHRGLILPGRPGAGRRSAARLAATLSSLRLVDAGPGRGRAAVKAAVQTAGIDGEPTLLLLEEYHAREEGLAVLTEAVVSRGELPGLFSAQELDGLIAPLADAARREDYPETLEQYLYHRLRGLLRVVVILDAGDVHEDWLSLSGLPRHCVFIGDRRGGEWWTMESLLTEVARERSRVEGDDDDVESPGVAVAVRYHLRAPLQLQAPARFDALLHAWGELREKWSKEIDGQLLSLEAGIGKLKEAGERVAKLEDEVSEQRGELEAEKGRAAAALEQITATMRGATGQRGEMTTLKAETEKESAELARRKGDIEAELGKVEPLVEQAAQAVAGIGADALAEVRSLRAPPAPVRDVLEGVLRLMGIRDTSWNSMKTFLAKRGIKDEIRSWDARRSTATSLEAVAKLIKDRPDSFDEKTARRASVAAAPLAAWVLANLQYGQILQQVAPLEREQRLLAERLSAAEAKLGRLAAGLSSVEDRVSQLQAELAEHSRGAAALQLRTEATESSLETARALLRKLDTEHSDWQAQFERLTERRGRLDEEAANAAALLVYQNTGMNDALKTLTIDLLTTERERLQWRAQGLPGDTESLVGAACALRGPLIPLFVDTSGVSVAWLKANFGSTLEATQPEEPRFLTTLELAVRFGKPLLVEELVELPSVLLPLLRRRPLRLGERTLPAQQGFRLFLATRREKLDQLPSEACSVLFRVTLGAGTKSLVERFVQKALLKETPELEIQRREALEREEKLAGERDAARLDLLAQLGAANGQDLLQESQGPRGGLLASLEATQSKAREIAVALEESRRSLAEVATKSKKREPLARFAANLFEAVKGLTSLSPLYVFSTEAFTDLYLEAEGAATGSLYSRERKGEEEGDGESFAERSLIALTLHYCAKAAYRKHRLPLALHVALSLTPVPEVEGNLLLDDVTIVNERDSNVEMPNWIPEERKSAVMALARALPRVASKLRAAWLEDVKNIYADESLTSFQKTLVIRALRPDHLHSALTKLATERLGVRDVAPPPWSLTKVAEETVQRPILLLLSPGADPGPELATLAGNNVASATGFEEVSLGQGQVAQAEAALEAACRDGSWLLLSNLQLALNWLPRLEGLLRSAACTSEKHPSARIWLTTEECRGFYAGLAGLCLKLAYEPPEGVKRNVKRSLQQLGQLRLAPGSTGGGMLLLAWLHAILQERRKFVPQGWIRAYEWSEADLEAALKLVVKPAATKQSEELDVGMDWEAGRGLLDVAIYGGRLQDAYDTRALQAILRNIWSKEVFDGRRNLGAVLNVREASNGDVYKAIERLGDVDSPRDYFGLPANAHRAWERAAAEAALILLKGVVARRAASGEVVEAGGNDGITRHGELRDLLDRRRSATRSRDRGSLKRESREEGATNPDVDPLDRFFTDERDSTTRLLALVEAEVAESAAFRGSKTPRNWLEEWTTGPREVLPFVHALLSRHSSLHAAPSSSSGDGFQFPREVNLSWFSRPRAFLAALKQHTARRSGQPLEDLRLRASWTDKSPGSSLVTIKALLVAGAAIADGCLKELDANAAPVAAAPDCRVAFVSDQTKDKVDDERRGAKYTKVEDEDAYLEIPVYTDSRRSDLICALPVACPREDRDAWLRRGVALHLRSS